MSLSLRKVARILFDLVLILNAVIVIFALKECAIAVWPILNEPYYIMNNLDPDAVELNDINWSDKGYLRYRDPDRDGDFDSFLKWKNSKGYTVDIAVRKNSRGEIEYPQLEPGSIEPHKALKKGIPVDYRWEGDALRSELASHQ